MRKSVVSAGYKPEQAAAVLRAMFVTQEPEALQPAWAVFDPMGRGHLTLREVQSIFAIFGESVDAISVKAEFVKLDTDQNGVLEFEELGGLLRRLAQLARGAPRRGIDMDGGDFDWVPPPGQLAAVCSDDQTGKVLDLGRGRVLSGQPAGIEQGDRPRSNDGNRLLHPEDPALEVGGVNLELQGSGEGLVPRRRQGRWQGFRLGFRPLAWRSEGGSGEEKQGQDCAWPLKTPLHITLRPKASGCPSVRA